MEVHWYTCTQRRGMSASALKDHGRIHMKLALSIIDEFLFTQNV